jgi:hypothetical protein
MDKKVHGGANLYKYIGTKSDKFVTGQKYTYADMAKMTGINIQTLRSRMGRIRGNVITDEVLLPKRKPFTNSDGTPFSSIERQNIPDRCETESEKMMNKYLRLAL